MRSWHQSRMFKVGEVGESPIEMGLVSNPAFPYTQSGVFVHLSGTG